MAFEKVKEYFEKAGLGDRFVIRQNPIDTVENAARAIGCEPAHIAKTMSFLQSEKPVLIVMAGDVKTDNKKYKTFFNQKAVMIPFDSVEELTGHAPGGVCPFAVKENVKVYLDISLKRFEYVYSAGGDLYSTIKLTPEEMEIYSAAEEWIDIGAYTAS